MSRITKFLLTILIFIQLSESPFAEQKEQCVPSNCGHIRNISYPFRLKSDPKHCGLKNYELSCEGDHTILTIPPHDWYGSQNYYVQAINYDNSTIRLVDPGIREQVICSLPQNSITYYTSPPRFSIIMDPDYVYFTITLFSCPFAITSPVSVEITNCLNRSYASNVSSDSNRGHTYATIGYLPPSDLEVGCSVDLMAMASWPIQDGNTNNSVLSWHNALTYGFELSWFREIHCSKCASPYLCEVENSRDVRCVDVGCRTYNFRFFKTSCIDQIHVLRVLATIVPWILPIAGFSIVARVILFPCIVVFLMIELRRRHLSIYDAIESFLHGENNFTPIRYSNSNIRKMTRNFKEKLGQGGYGSVYKGKLQSGPNVAVKILSKPKADGQDFINEVATIGRIHHVNIVQLIGYCAERCKRALVYDFMPKGSLEKYITPREGGAELLSWKRKFEIALGVARGIEYLHRGCDIQILHFDIKPHNILLDENFIPKLSDFGLAKSYPTDKSIVTLTAVRGTIGYVAPELINRSIGPISYKADVYSFGMLLIDIVGLKTNSVAREDMSSQYFPHWIYDQLDKGKEIEVLDETHEDVKKLTLVALWCIQMNPLDRPSMTRVVEMLEGDLQALQTPPRPSESREPCSLEFNLTSSSMNSTESVKLLESCSDSAIIDVIVV
ncbi:rust resistance kinase Lr10-like [Solanum lycopersicum]|uniref:rust resistance kinase Lr10-like n=1 Tax=Solanum lycopersicum TaxID=4081 RepID=UPI00374A7F3F